MRPLSQFLRLAAAVVCGGLLLAGPAQAQKTQTKKGSYPAAEGFDQAGSDPKAIAIADKVMNAMGGYDAWRNTRYLAWSFFGANTRSGTNTPAIFTGKKIRWWPTTT
ncbi:hypothetical protein [Hymenobacter radiodurans]|uniref:hypothetical protein n=1 Tax=Hymenobacter radiodurans TaxID=2496028 RepID=UPI001058DAEC|nr:hypothetical protein [Hymenobacter radiodurans]